jgi:hypothetical protein
MKLRDQPNIKFLAEPGCGWAAARRSNIHAGDVKTGFQEPLEIDAVLKNAVAVIDAEPEGNFQIQRRSGSTRPLGLIR